MESSTVVKALGLLESISRVDHGKSLADLAIELRIPKPTAHRLLKTLAGVGYVEKDGPGIYRRGPAFERLRSTNGQEELRSIAGPVLRALRATTRETVNLGVLRQSNVVYLDVFESPQPLRRVATVESTDPFYCTALGRAIAAFLPAQQVDHLFASVPLRKLTPSTVVDEARLRQLLRKARQAKCAIEVDQTDIGVTCIAAPIVAKGRVLAAVSLSVPSSRLNTSRSARWVKLVRASAGQISRQCVATMNASSGEDYR